MSEEVQVETNYTVDEDNAIFEFSLPSASIRVRMATGERGAEDVTLLVLNVEDLLRKSIAALKED